MVAANEEILNRKSGEFASRRRCSLCRSVMSVADRPVDCVTSFCHDHRQSRFPLRSPPLPRGSKDFVPSWLCGEKSVSGTQPMVSNLYQGMALDPVAGLYYERNRNYPPSLGTWISQDPLQYINGANTYLFLESNPVNYVDISGFYSMLALAEIIWNETSGLYPQYNSSGPQNYTNYNPQSQAQLNAAHNGVTPNPRQGGASRPYQRKPGAAYGPFRNFGGGDVPAGGNIYIFTYNQ